MIYNRAHHLDDLRAMVVFAVVARCGSFAAAARELGLTRAGVGQQIRGLESRLGIALAHRNTRHLTLTHAGEVFALHCQKLADEAAAGIQALELMRDEPGGVVRITCSHHFGQRSVVPALVAFRKRYPSVEVDIRTTDANIDVISEGIDLALRAGPLADSTLRARRLLTEPTFICAAPSYLDGVGEPVTPEDLAALRWVVYPPGRRTVTLTREGEGAEVAVTGSVRTDSAASRLAFVLSGEGIARLPGYDARPALAAGNLVQILPDWHPAAIQIYLVYSEQIGPTAKLLADFLCEHMRAPAQKWPTGAAG